MDRNTIEKLNMESFSMFDGMELMEEGIFYVAKGLDHKFWFDEDPTSRNIQHGPRAKYGPAHDKFVPICFSRKLGHAYVPFDKLNMRDVHKMGMTESDLNKAAKYVTDHLDLFLRWYEGEIKGRKLAEILKNMDRSSLIDETDSDTEIDMLIDQIMSEIMNED